MKSLNKFTKINKKDIWNAENIYHLKTDVTRISKLVYHYEIYKKITSLPGDIIECGVFKGISLVRFLTFRNFLENNYSRKIYGFDSFGKFPKSKKPISSDKKFIKDWERKDGNSIDINELNDVLKNKEFKNFELVKGDVKNTIPKLLKKRPELMISLLHLDMDVYEPTKLVLNKLFKHVVRGGIILIDDYSCINGATKIINEFLSLNKNLEIKKLNFYHRPSFIIKT